jgi:hypothetical protein
MKTPEERAALLAFTPVPRDKPRADGWTPERQQAFIEALADCGIVSRAARMIGMTPEGAYALRRHPQGASFAEAWENAQGCGIQRLTDIAIERAIEGVPVPIFYKGEQVGERRWYNDKLLIFALRHHDPDRYGGNAGLTLSPRARKLMMDKARAQIFEEQQAERDARESRYDNTMLKNIHALERSERAFRAEGRTDMADEMAAMLALVWLRIEAISHWNKPMQELMEQDPLPTFGYDNDALYRQARGLHKLCVPSAYPEDEGGSLLATTDSGPDTTPPSPSSSGPTIRTF